METPERKRLAAQNVTNHQNTSYLSPNNGSMYWNGVDLPNTTHDLSVNEDSGLGDSFLEVSRHADEVIIFIIFIIFVRNFSQFTPILYLDCLHPHWTRMPKSQTACPWGVAARSKHRSWGRMWRPRQGFLETGKVPVSGRCALDCASPGCAAEIARNSLDFGSCCHRPLRSLQTVWGHLLGFVRTPGMPLRLWFRWFLATLGKPPPRRSAPIHLS